MSELIAHKEGLQKFTLESIKKIHTKEDFWQLPEDKQEDLQKYVRFMFNYFANEAPRPLNHEQTELFEEIRRLLVTIFGGGKEETEIAKTDMWQATQQTISNAIHNHIINYRQVPNISAISQQTGFSRPTIYKHMEALKGNKMYQEYIEEFNALIPVMMSQLYKLFMTKANVKAGRLLMDIMGMTKQNPKNQYIQVNNITVTNDDIQKLPTGKRIEFEQYLHEIFTNDFQTITE